MKISIIAFCMVLLLSACSSPDLQFITGTIDHAFSRAKKENKKLLIITKADGCSSCIELSKQIETSKPLRKMLAKNFLIYESKQKQVGNEYLDQIFHSIATPTLYFFDSSGKLVNSSIGDLHTSELYELIQASSEEREIYFRNGGFKLNLNEKDFIDFANQMLNSYRVFKDTSSEKSAVMESIKQLEKSLIKNSYFFNNYLLAKLYSRVGEIDKSLTSAKKALQFEEVFDVFLYQSLRNELKYLLDKNYDATNLGLLVFSTETHDFGVVKLGTHPKANIKFRNIGKKSINIQRVLGSCNCMDFKWPKNGIKPSEEGEIEVEYKADHQGPFSKLVYIISNGAKGISQIKITGIVD